MLTWDNLGCVDLNEPLAVEEFSEQFTHARLQSEDGLVGRGAQVDHAVVQARVLAHCRQGLQQTTII